MSKDTLTPAQVDQYRRDGYIVVDSLLTPHEVETFLEHESVEQPPERRKGLKTHLVDPEWAYIARHPRIAGAAAQLFGGMPRIVQTLYTGLIKPPAVEEDEGTPNEAPLHQDHYVLPNEPPTLLACWIALNDTDAGNGGFCVVPGSHQGLLRGTRTDVPEEQIHMEDMIDPDGRKWQRKNYHYEIADLSRDKVEHLTIPTGAGVFFSDMTIHGSYPNRSKDRWRYAFAIHYVKDGTWVYRADVNDTDPVTELATI